MTLLENYGYHNYNDLIKLVHIIHLEQWFPNLFSIRKVMTQKENKLRRTSLQNLLYTETHHMAQVSNNLRI